MNINLKELKKFLSKANLAGYASVQEGIVEIKEKDGSKTITYKDKNWFFHDNYFGGEPYGGREVIFANNKPVFMMVYYGMISDKNINKELVYKFLRKALKLFPEDAPFRGPKIFKETIDKNNYKYENTWSGDVDYFSGQEKIFIDEKEIYVAQYSGGLVDM